MITNALNDVQSNIYIQQNIIKKKKKKKKKVRKDDKVFAEKRDFKDIKFSAEIRNIHKIEKIILLALLFLVMKIRKNIQFMYQKNFMKKNMLIYY